MKNRVNLRRNTTVRLKTSPPINKAYKSRLIVSPKEVKNHDSYPVSPYMR